MNRMVWSGVMVIGVGGLLIGSGLGDAAEHGGKEHGGAATTPAATQEPGGVTHEHGDQAAPIEPSAEQLRQAIRDYVQQMIQEEGAFTIEDEVSGTTRTLELVRVHERVGKTGELYYSCTDMRDTRTGQILDLDFDVEATADGLDVVDTRIHKVEGQARYTYDNQDRRVPVTQ